MALLARSLLQPPACSRAAVAAVNALDLHQSHQKPMTLPGIGFGTISSSSSSGSGWDARAGVFVRHFSSGLPVPRPDSGEVQVVEAPLPPSNVGPWQKLQDKQTGSCYWWNQSTNVTTPVGAPKPDAWVQVVAKDGRVYFWNKDSNITTAVGEPMPGPEGRIAAYREQVASGRSATFNLITYPLAIGVGFGLIAGVLRAIF